VLVSLGPLVGEMELELKRRTEATNPPPADDPDCIQALGRVPTPGLPAFGQLLPAVATIVEHEGMEIDLPPLGVT
jgi:hypothetical protein